MVENFSGFNANIYSEDGTLMQNVRIEDHDRGQNTIEVPGLPEELLGKRYDVVVLKAPVPQAFKGIARKSGASKIITLYKGHETEQRKGTRYKTDLPGIIEHLIFDDIKYMMHTPLDVKIINISKNGLRLQTIPDALAIGLRFSIRITSGKDDQVLVADVVNELNVPTKPSEYGCRFAEIDGESQ